MLSQSWLNARPASETFANNIQPTLHHATHSNGFRTCADLIWLLRARAHDNRLISGLLSISALKLFQRATTHVFQPGFL